MSDTSPVAGVPVSPPHMHQQPVVGPFPALVMPKPVTFTLANGLNVIAVRREAAPIVALNLVLRTGADHDPPGQTGLASLTAEMMDEGAGARSAMEIAEVVERLGADLWVGAGRDGAQLNLQVPSDVFRPALEVAADIILRPRFEAADWERVYHDRMTALQQRRDQPEAVADLITALTLYGPDHQYGRPVDGLESSLSAIGLDDVRAFHGRFWRPNNAVITMAGDFDPATLRDELEGAFGAWQPAALPETRPTPPLPPLPRLVLVDRPGAPQSVLRIVGPGTSRRSPDRPAVSMLNVVLGGTFTSRLNFTLREKKGYTYGASSGFSAFRRPSSFTVRTSVFTQMTAGAVGDALAEIGRMRTDEIDGAEMTKARATLFDRTAEALATASGVAGTFADIGLYELPGDEPARFIAAVAATTPDDVRQAAVRYLDPEKLGVIVVGDRAAVEPALRELGLPAPVLLDPEGAPA
jgi:predicted Zn-dependent peptidase